MKLSGAGCQPLLAKKIAGEESYFWGPNYEKSSCVALSVAVKSSSAEKRAGTENVVKTQTSKEAGLNYRMTKDCPPPPSISMRDTEGLIVFYFYPQCFPKLSPCIYI